MERASKTPTNSTQEAKNQPLEWLPIEVIFLILNMLEIKDILSFRSTTRRNKTLTDSFFQPDQAKYEQLVATKKHLMNQIQMTHSYQ
ncbi:F-box protein [Legionella gresilensis]|uniref:F-box protein n=1 Tax=Legionella gresilensis TaxID=91823 RepID=UPI0010418D4F|nr:F-box protein [Legionella gresilensis]